MDDYQGWEVRLIPVADPREIEYVSSYTPWDGLLILGWSADMPLRDIKAMIAEDDERDRARRIELGFLQRPHR